MTFSRDVAIIGGCGRAGLPLGIAFGSRGLRVALYDIDNVRVEQVNRGQTPYVEEGAGPLLKRVLADGLLEASSNPAVIATAENVIVVIGTPVDEHLNPDPLKVLDAIEKVGGWLRDGQLLVLRSTVYPGVTAKVERLITGLGRQIEVCFCPERIAEGQALIELFELPQIVGARGQHTLERAEKLFRHLTEQTAVLTPEEAELSKLFTNSWRYIKFAIANQFYMIANDFGLDFERIRSALTFDYPRAADMPRAGFAAGPCLLKDSMQLAAFNNNNFVLGQASMMINEGLPLYIVAQLEKKQNLSNMTVGILGMAFKAESDDNRSSLSYKLKRILKVKAAGVLCTDPYVKDDPDLVSLEDVLARSELLILATPHEVYANLRTDLPVVDVWNLRGHGVKV